MESKFKKKNIFESSFDSFEFDDGFLMKVDSELKKNKINEKNGSLLNKCDSKKKDKQNEKEIKKVSDIKDNHYDLPLFIEDFDDSDFFDWSKSKCKKSASKVVNCKKDEKVKKGFSNGFTICLSPIQGPNASSNKLNLSSSTPLKPNDDSLPKEKPSTSQKLEKNTAKNTDFDYLEADLFDDWNIDETNKDSPKNTQKSTVTFSQAMKLIEEAESERQLDQGSLNHSLDLLTGEVVGGDMEKMFEESFDVPEKKSEKNDSLIIINEIKVGCKPVAAQKLNFGSEKVNCVNLNNDNEFNFYEGFDSDDDFDFFTQELTKKSEAVPKQMKPNSDLKKTKNVTPEKDSDLNDSTDEIIRKKKRGKCFKIIESDGTEDSPSPKFLRQNNAKRGKNFQENFGRAFIESEAEVSDEVEVSSDEIEVDGEYDKSFLDEESYYSQNCSANMTAKYLESVKTVHRNGNFKIPASKPYIPDNVFSQIPEENNTDYEIDSFCVPNDVEEEEMKTELSVLEVAEKVLEMDRKKRKKKRSQKFRKLKY